MRSLDSRRTAREIDIDERVAVTVVAADRNARIAAIARRLDLGLEHLLHAPELVRVGALKRINGSILSTR